MSLLEDAASLFGFQIVPKEKEKQPESFAPEQKDDGAVVVAAGGSYGTYVDLEGTVRTEAELVTRYREMSLLPEVSDAIEDIVNEALVVDQDYIVRMDCDKLPIEDNIKDRIREEFEEVLDLFNFDNDAFEIFKRFYVDGRMYYHVIIDRENPQEGIKELRYIDPRKIRKVRELQQAQTETGVPIKKVVDEYYIYNDRGFPIGSATDQQNSVYGSATGLKIATDAILQITSGVMDKNNSMVLSHLHKAIKPLNQLRTLEDATVIYRISRAPERRIFYIDVGNLPKAKAEQYLESMMRKHKNKLVYDANTGEVRDDRKFMTMLEDYWLPRREGGKGTEISTLPAGENLGELTDVNYFLKKLMNALGVPVSRLDPEAGFSIGRASEISRDEIKFSKFVNRQRKRFSQMFVKAMEKQLILKGVCTKQEWKDFARHVVFDYMEDNHFAELKDAEIMEARLQLAQSMQQYVGRYYSNEYVRKHILRQSEEEIEDMDNQIAEEKSDPQYQQPMGMGMDGMGMGMGMGMDPMGGGGMDPFGAGGPQPDFPGDIDDANGFGANPMKTGGGMPGGDIKGGADNTKIGTDQGKPGIKKPAAKKPPFGK